MDVVLGSVRLCGECREWWPDDEEFWNPFNRARCLACQSEREMVRGVVRRGSQCFVSSSRSLQP